jgi:hypothetical protein
MSNDKQKLSGAALKNTVQSSLEAKVQSATLAEDSQTVDAERAGVKELTDVLTFSVALAGVIVETVGDGIGPLDVLDLLRDEDLRESLAPMLDGISDVPDEAADLSFREINDLIQHVTSEIQKQILS